MLGNTEELLGTLATAVLLGLVVAVGLGVCTFTGELPEPLTTGELLSVPPAKLPSLSA